MPKSLPPDLLSAALEGLEQRKRRVEMAIAELRQQLAETRGAPPVRARSGEGGPNRPPLSPEARERIAAAQRKRWEQYRSSHSK